MKLKQTQITSTLLVVVVVIVATSSSSLYYFIYIFYRIFLCILFSMHYMLFFYVKLLNSWKFNRNVSEENKYI